jgi:protein involved in polysaccharide export with SLBB domain
LGEALRRPGAYTLSGFNTAFNALSLVGGPSDIGSLRNILVQKSDGQKLELDVYAFMTDPSVQNDFYLNDNDIILIPVSEKIVEIQGAVRRPLKYELKDGEMLSALLRFAGGFADNAYMDKIQVVRYEANKQRIIDINLTEYMAEGRDFELRNGDEIIVSEIEKSFDNYVSVTGEVYQPGQYERTNNMRISDIVSMAGLTPRSNTSLIYLIRTNPDNTKALLKLDFDRIKSNLGDKDNLLLADGDKIEIWSKDRFTDESVISDSGAV